MEQIPSEATSSSVTREFPNILWNPKVHYRVRYQVHKPVVMKRPVFSYVTLWLLSKATNVLEEHSSSLREPNYPCGGGVKYLHRDPASRRRRRKGKSQIWDSKIWSRVTRDSDLRKTALARASSIYKRQTRPLVREGAPQKQDRNCQTVINIWSWVPDGARHQDWLSVTMWLWLWVPPSVLRATYFMLGSRLAFLQPSRCRWHSNQNAFSILHGVTSQMTGLFTTPFSRVHHWSLCSARSLQPILHHPKIHFNIIHPLTSWSS
jgi:hypothetical protein